MKYPAIRPNRRIDPRIATPAEVAAYCRAHPEAIEELAEMQAGERAAHVSRVLHARSLTDAELAEECRAQTEAMRQGALEDARACRWFLLCDREATTVRTHPVLGRVPCCERCARRADG